MFNYILSDQSCTILLDNQLSTIPRTNRKWERLLEAIKTADLTAIRGFMNPESSANTFCQGYFKIDNGIAYYQDQPLAYCLSKRIVNMMDDGFDIQPMVRFVNNLMSNPSNRAIQETYAFLEVCNLPITEDGCFIAYKRIRDNWMDVYSNTLDNHIGNIVAMPRNQVDDVSERTCSHGLHVCSIGYLTHYTGNRLVAVKVNPRNVVSIPTDYENSKMRVCEYTVVQELDMTTIAAFDKALRSVWVGDRPMDDDEPDEDEMDDDETDEEYNDHYAEDAKPATTYADNEDDGYTD